MVQPTAAATPSHLMYSRTLGQPACPVLLVLKVAQTRPVDQQVSAAFPLVQNLEILLLWHLSLRGTEGICQTHIKGRHFVLLVPVVSVSLCSLKNGICSFFLKEHLLGQIFFIFGNFTFWWTFMIYQVKYCKPAGKFMVL